MNWSAHILVVTFAVLSGWAANAAEMLTNRFGFTGKEIFPIDHQISQLHAADLDGDGLQDLIVVNNTRSRISLLFNQTGKTNLPAKSKRDLKREINELPPDARFRIESVASEKRISSLVVTDLNSDGQPDLAYYGEPKELVVQYNGGTNGWSAAKRWPIEDGLLNPNALTHGDLNADGREDLLLLGDGFSYWLAQEENRALAEPARIPYSGTVQAAQVLDIQGDGRADLLLVNWDSPNPFRFRLQSENQQLGPEIHFTLPPVRSYWADDLDKDQKTEVITVAQKSGRAQVYNFTQRKADLLSGVWMQGQLQVLPLKRTAKAKRGTLWADVNGDKLPDLLVAEPDSGQLTVFIQQPTGWLAAPKTFATLVGISELAVGEWKTTEMSEIFLLSADERQIGVTQFDAKGLVGFPKMLPLEGRPLSMAVGRLDPNGLPVLTVIMDFEGKRELQILSGEGKLTRQKLSESFKSNPSSMAIHDVNQDGRPDIVILIAYEKIKTLLQVEGKDLEEIDAAPPGGAVEQPWLTTTDVDGDGKEELLLAQKNFLRAVVLEAGAPAGSSTNKSPWAFTVKEQINGVASNSRIVGAAALRNGSNRVASLFLLDAERKSLTLCERDKSGAWQIVRNLPLPMSEFQSLQATALGGSTPNTIALHGVNAAAWMSLGGNVWELNERDGYETPIRDAYLNDVISGDLNQDGRKDLVFLETGKGYLDIVTFEPPHQLVPANRWQVFEERSFRSRRVDAGEPREALIADLNKDGKNDLAIVVHDRIIVYLQE